MLQCTKMIKAFKKFIIGETSEGVNLKGQIY